VRSKQELQQHQAVIDWLSPNDFASQQHDIISRKEEGTGKWFLDSPEFEAWQQGPEKTLFCPGIPGAGKTMLAAISIDHICKRAESEDIGIAYLFCNYKAQQEQSCAALLAAILRQLVQSRPDTADPVTRMYEKHQKQRSNPSLDELFKALQSVCSTHATVFIIVDALDECRDRDDTRSRLIGRLRELQANTNTRLMFTSRFIPEVKEKFASEPTLEVRASDQDVKLYVAGKLPSLPRCIRHNSGLAHDVQDKIADAVDGM
jgi:Cdc6-like AAA superfamily ATPase